MLNRREKRWVKRLLLAQGITLEEWYFEYLYEELEGFPKKDLLEMLIDVYANGCKPFIPAEAWSKIDELIQDCESDRITAIKELFRVQDARV